MIVRGRARLLEEMRTTLRTASGHRPIHARRALEPAHAKALLSLAHVSWILENCLLRYPDLRLVRAGAVIDVRTYTVAVPPAADAPEAEAYLVPRVPQVLDEFHRGATLLVQGLHRFWPALRALCSELQAVLAVPVQADVVVTPARARGLNVHVDAYDSIIVQTSGIKDWEIFEGRVPLPIEGRIKREGNRAHGPLLMRARLRPGDWLYLPRGFPHAATAGRTASIHATLSLFGRPWLEPLADLMRSPCARALSFRRPLPAALFANRGRSIRAARSQLEALARRLLQVDPAAAMPLFTDDAHAPRKRLLPLGALSNRNGVRHREKDESVNRRRKETRNAGKREEEAGQEKR